MPTSRIHYQQVLGDSVRDKRLDVLRSLHRGGSISEAARANGISYKAAWQAIETLSNLAGVSLVVKTVGGSGGGGARLTTEGVQVLQVAEWLNAAQAQALEQLAGLRRHQNLNLKALARLGLRTSMRNQIPCVVQRVIRSAGTARVVLELPDGQTIASRITAESLQLLGLKKGREVLALFKATAVTIAPTIVAVGAVNLLRGHVVRRGHAPTGTEVSLQLSTGLGIVGFADPAQGLRLRQSAMAAFEDHAVVIGLGG
jgi:molybdate transport system regulatory protein